MQKRYVDHPSLTMLRELSERYGLDDGQLTIICQTATGFSPDYLTPGEAERLAAMLVAKGPEKSIEWAQELRRLL